MENIEKRLKKEIEESTPDVLDAVLSSCKERNRYKPMKKQRKALPIVALAASFALIFGAVFGIMVYTNSSAVDSVVSIDVNPSVELQLNKKEKVVSAYAVNDDGLQILKDSNLLGLTVESAVEKLINEMTDKGYIDSDKNSVLISVKSDDKQHADELSEKLLDSAYKCIDKRHGKGAVLTQSFSGDEDSARNIADTYGLSYGKAKLITKIMEKDSLMTADKLAGLPMNDLNLLIQENGIELDEIKCKGQASDSTYITSEAAKLSAFAEAGVKEEDVTRLKVKMDCENRTMVYEVEFTVGGIEYEYEIHAQTGEILDVETEEEKDKGNGNGQSNSQGNGQGNGQGKLPSVDSSSFIGEEKALKTALDDSGLTEDVLTQKKVKLHDDDGVIVYEVKLKTADNEKYEYEIDALTGEILDFDHEVKGSQKAKNEIPKV